MIDKWSMRLLLTRREENNKVFNDKTGSFPPRPTFPLALLDGTPQEYLCGSFYFLYSKYLFLCISSCGVKSLMV